MKHPTEENHLNLKQIRHTLLREKTRAKRRWQFEFASKCKKNDFCLKPKEAWSMVFKLMEGFTKLHRMYRPTNFKYKNGIEAKNDNENAEILNIHFNSLFNSQVQVDLTVLNNLPQNEISKTSHRELLTTTLNLSKISGQSPITTSHRGMSHY